MGDLYSVDEIASTPSENISGEISSEATITETDPSSDAASCGDDGDYFVSDPLVDPLVDPDLDVCVDTRTPDGMALALEQVQSSDFQQQTAGLESLESNPELDACFVPTDKGNEPYILAQTISKDPVRNAVGWKTAERAGILEKAIRLVEKIIENLKQMIEKGEIEAQALIKDFVKRATHPQAQERVKKIAENSSKSTPISSSSQKGNRKSAAAIGASGSISKPARTIGTVETVAAVGAGSVEEPDHKSHVVAREGAQIPINTGETRTKDRIPCTPDRQTIVTISHHQTNQIDGGGPVVASRSLPDGDWTGPLEEEIVSEPTEPVIRQSDGSQNVSGKAVHSGETLSKSDGSGSKIAVFVTAEAETKAPAIPPDGEEDLLSDESSRELSADAEGQKGQIGLPKWGESETLTQKEEEISARGFAPVPLQLSPREVVGQGARANADFAHYHKKLARVTDESSPSDHQGGDGDFAQSKHQNRRNRDGRDDDGQEEPAPEDQTVA